MSRFLPLLALLLAAPGCPGPEEARPAADLVVRDGKIWTGAPDRPWAKWVAVRGGRILTVGAGEPPAAARTLDAAGRLVVPGFNDSHVHFGAAGRLLLGANLLDASDDATFRRRIGEAAGRLPSGSWITGGDWGAYEAWALGSDGRRRGRTTYLPSRDVIDDVTPDHPVLVTRFDRKVGLANATALRALGLTSATGILEGPALEDAVERIPPRSVERRMAEARRALLECRRWGVTSVQDMSGWDQLPIYEQLREAGELTARIHFSPSRLPDYREMIDRGWSVGAGDEWLRFGAIKTHVDGIMGNRTARFRDPYADNTPENAGWRGSWREFSEDLPRFEEMLTAADAAGIQLRVHAIGDEAHSVLLDILERIKRGQGRAAPRFRLVHAQVIGADDLARLGDHDIVAEVQPYHCADDMRWMEERIGAARCEGAYAFRSLLDAGCTLALGSDWPGTNASYYPVNPLVGLYAAVTRQTVKGTPPGGWFPGQRLSLEEALRAYTWGGAYASFEEDLKGTIREGMLADLAILDTDLFEAAPADWLDARVDVTIVGGAIVHDRTRDGEIE